MSKVATGQQPYHTPSPMTLPQVDEYMLLLVERHDVLGDLYVARQLQWAEAEQTRIEASV